MHLKNHILPFNIILDRNTKKQFPNLLFLSDMLKRRYCEDKQNNNMVYYLPREGLKII
jgi:hypothetical protein